MALVDYERAIVALPKPLVFGRVAAEAWFATAELAVAKHQMRGLSWELEFPDVFFHSKGRLPNAGFDAVIGNPPYDVLSEAETGHDLSSLRAAIDNTPEYEPSKRGKNNLYKLFICRSLQLLADDAYLGFITPMAILGDDQTAELRKAMLAAARLVRVDAFPQKDDPKRRIFPEAKLSTAVFILHKTADASTRGQPFRLEVHPGRLVSEVQAAMRLATDQLPLYDPSNLSIVSCSQADWDLAVKIMQTGRMSRLADFAEFFQGEVNETNDRGRGTISYDDADGPRVVRGAGICLYTVRSPSQGKDFFVLKDRFLAGKNPDSKAFHHQYARVGVQESCPQNNFRRIIAAFIPKGEFCNHKVNYCPSHRCKFDLRFMLALLNSKLSDWYFRLGSTNAAVSHYQLYNLPTPVFMDVSSETQRTQDLVRRAITDGRIDDAMKTLRQMLGAAPFDALVREAIISAVDCITNIEDRRRDMSRSDRSALAKDAQPYQDFIDELWFRMAGMTNDEIAGLELRLTTML